MRKNVSLLISVLIVIIINIAVCAESIKIGDVTYNYTVTEDNSAHITSMSSQARGEIRISEKLGEYPVTHIDSFVGLKNAESIIMPDTVITIGNFAFSNMSNLKKVILSQRLTAIPDYAFTRCTELTTINIPSSVTSIGKSAFNYCELLRHVSLSENLTSIGDRAFIACKTITSINFPNGLTHIGSNAFFNCNVLQNVLIPKSVTSIGSHAFLQNSRDDMPSDFKQYHVFRTYKNIRYTGTEEEWKKIKIGNYNTNLTSSPIKFNAPALFVKFERQSENTVFTVTAENLDGALISISGYSDKTLSHFASGLSDSGSTVKFEIPHAKNCDTVKVFAFDRFVGIKPLCENSERVFNI